MSERFTIHPDTVGQWNDYLAEFEKKGWPIFQHYGYSRDAALLVWFTCQTKNAVDSVHECLTEPPEQWKS